jgi:hypothetical protein
MEGNDHGEAYTAIVWGGLLSRESSNPAEAEAVSVAEGNMCGTVKRGAVALPWSKTPSRTKGTRRNLGDPLSDQWRRAALVRIGKARSRSR